MLPGGAIWRPRAGPGGAWGQGLCLAGLGEGAWRGGVSLTSSSSGARRGPSWVLRSRTGARGRSRTLRSAPSAAPTSRASASPSAPRSAGSSALTCRACGGRGRGRGSWAAARRPRRLPPGGAPGAAAHLPLVEREVAEAQQAQPAHGGLGVALPGVQPLQDALLPQEPRGGPALQQLSRGHGLSTLPSQRRQCCLGRGSQPPLTPLPEAGSPQ